MKTLVTPAKHVSWEIVRAGKRIAYFKTMKGNLLIICIFLFARNVIFAQNLVPNHSFEDTPCTGTQEQQEYIYNTPHWFSPNGKTTDIYHSCKTVFDWLKTPNPPFGPQVPSHGQGYAGIRLFLDPNTPNSSGQHNYREYLATKLNSPLEKDKTYVISFKYSVAEAASLTTDDLGIYVSTDPIPNQDVLTFQPQVRNPEGNILTNTSDWGTISGNYTAHGGEEYIVIGNFNNDANTTMVPKPYVHSFNTYTSYYYIDEVVVESCKADLPDRLLPSDTLLCDKQELLLDVEIPNGKYLWNNQSTDSQLKVNTAGLYSVRITSGNCSTVESIQVRYTPPIEVSLGADRLMCEGESILLDATVQNGSYKWNNNSTNATMLVDKPGTYSVQVTVGNCSVVREITIEEAFPDKLLPSDTLLCDQEQLLIDVKIPNGKYLWSNQSTDSQLKVSTAGLYSVRITSGDCSMMDSIRVRFASPIEVNIGADSLICKDESILLDATIQNGSYQWNNSSTNATMVVDRPGTYSVQVSVGNCSAVSEVVIRSGNCIFFVPNIITPNGDGKNDAFTIETDFKETTLLWLVIYNRWGNKIYESANYDNSWNGDGLSDGIYFYKCGNDDSGAVSKGAVTIVR